MPPFSKNGRGHENASNGHTNNGHEPSSNGKPKAASEDDVASALRPFVFHGMVFNQPRPGETQARSDCPFCGAEGKFYVGLIDKDRRHFAGGWWCHPCSSSGNADTFLTKLWESSFASTGEDDLEGLALDRGILYAETLRRWGVARSTLNGDWLVPAYNADGGVSQLYRYQQLPGGNKRALFATPGTNAGSGLFGPKDAFGRKPNHIDLCEGPWDGMAYEEALTGGRGAPSGRVVVAAPGANTFLVGWSSLFGGRTVSILYDNDHERTHPESKKPIDGAGLAGVKRVAAILSVSGSRPKGLHYLDWSGEGKQWNGTLPSGCDLRDLFSQEADAAGRFKVVETIHSSLKEVPAEWIEKAKAAIAHQIEPLPCSDWATLDLAWSAAMEWTAGLRGGLISMLAVACGVPLVGEQLWMKIVGPPSCLDGSTPIHDPVNGTTRTVRQRYEDGSKFFVYSRKGDRIGVAEALPPQRYPKAAMYEVVFKSGRRIRTTGGHRFWTGGAYVALHEVSEALRRSGAFRLPTISAADLSTRMQDALRSTRTVAGSQLGYRPESCSGGEQLRPGSEVCLGTLPSPAGVPERSLESLRAGVPAVSDTRTLRFRRPDLLSSSSGLLRAESLLSGGVSEFLALSGISLRSISSLRRTDLPETSTRPSGTRLPPSVSGSQTRDGLQSLRHDGAGHSSRSLLLREGFDSTMRSNDRSGNDLQSRSDGLPTSVFSPQDASPPLLVSDIFALPGSRPACESKPQPESSPTGTDQWPVGYDHGSTKQSYVAPIQVVHKTLDPRILTETDEIVSVIYVGECEYFDFHVPETQNYWAEGLFHHNCGKSTLCEAISVARKYVLPKDTFSGLTSGYQVDKEGSQNLSLVLKIDGKTLAIKDADTILQHPNKGPILSQFRALYDRAFRTTYNNKMSVDHDNINTGVILCGTSSLRVLDDSELGQRFLDFEIMAAVDPRTEEKINAMSLQAYRQLMNNSPMTNGDGADGPEKIRAKRLTGGYVEYLRDNIDRIVRGIKMSDEALEFCNKCGKFVAYFRSRPSGRQTEEVHRELSTRLVLQHAKLAYCTAAVLNKDSVDEEVLNRLREVALCTARGTTLNIGKMLYVAQGSGAETKAVALYLGETDEAARKLLRFLRRINVVEQFEFTSDTGMKRWRWRLAQEIADLYGDLIDPDGSLIAQYQGYE